MIDSKSILKWLNNILQNTYVNDINSRLFDAKSHKGKQMKSMLFILGRAVD